MTTQASILLIEDSPGECELFGLALAKAGVVATLHSKPDAEPALQFLTACAGHDPLPSLIVLDWHLQKGRGDGFLTAMRADARFASIPVIVLTTSDDAADMVAAYAHGANGYVVKPDTFDELVRCVGDLCRYWLMWNRCLPLVETTC
jgi:DNA-binding response OmpR family regulator